jgi:hypothetical protein
LDSFDHSDPAPPRPPGHTPLGLDYFAAQAPERKASRAGNLAVGTVAFSVLPFICGVINVLVATTSYSPTVTGSHRGGATLFLAAGVLLCALGMTRLVALRHWGGVVFAGAVLVGEVAVVVCAGLSMI